MEMKKCSNCNCKPCIQSSDVGMIFRLICPKCGKFTGDILSPTAQLGDKEPDEETLQRLIEEWNLIN